MAEKLVTIMRLKVDLQCHKCYMKVKKVLCKFPQIRDQTYDEKNDTVTIKVVCCSPEKLRDKLCCYGGGSIKSIEIVVTLKPKPPGGGGVIVVDDARPPRPTPRAAAEPPPAAPPPEPLKQDDKPPPPPPPAVKFSEPVPVSVLALPSPAFASVGRGSDWPMSYYGRPIYDSYGGRWPSYVGCHCQNLSVEEDAPECTIA